MKKNLLFSLVALFFCNLMVFAGKPVDVTSKYMDNFTDPYRYLNMFTAVGDTVTEFNPEDLMGENGSTNITVNGEQVSVPRFHRLAEPWKLAGEIAVGEGTAPGGDPNTLATGWHVDLQKATEGRRDANIKGALTLTVGWDGFTESIENAKVYQKLKQDLPVGKYKITSAYAQDASGAENTYLVVTKAEILPDIADLETNADVLKYTRLSDSTHVVFELESVTSVTVGLVASLTDRQCSSMGDFSIQTWIDGTDYSKLQELLNSANEMTEESYPLGSKPGHYSQDKWDAFVQARDAAKVIIDNIAEGNPTDPEYKDNHTQEQVDTALNNLKTAIEELDASFVTPFFFSTTEKEWWYTIHDRRNPYKYWLMADAELGGEYVPRLSLESIESFEGDADNEAHMFKFVKTEESNAFYIYCKKYPNLALSLSSEDDSFVQAVEGKDTTWLVGKYKATGAPEGYYRLNIAGSEWQPNSQGDIVGKWNVGNGRDPGNDWMFDRVLEEGETDFKAIKREYSKVDTISGVTFPIGTMAGQFPQEKWDAFVAARATVKGLIEKELVKPQPTQEEVDAAKEALIIAYRELSNSMVPPMIFSTSEKEQFYALRDQRDLKKDEEGNSIKPANYWFYDNEAYRLIIKSEEEIEDVEGGWNNEGFYFKFVKPEGETTAFLIYAENAPEAAIYYDGEDDENYLTNGDDATTDTTLFVARRTLGLDADYYSIVQKTRPYKALNSDLGNKVLGFWWLNVGNSSC